LSEAVGVEAVSPNELGRHFAASLLYDAGMSLDTIADLLGHASTRILEAHYRHRVRTSFGAHVAPIRIRRADNPRALWSSTIASSPTDLRPPPP
jgi:integrase